VAHFRIQPRWAVAATTLVCAAVVLSDLPPVLRAPFGFALVLWLPGCALLGLADPGRRDAERTALAIALSLAITVGAGLCLNLADGLTVRGWTIALAGTTLLACAVPRRDARAALLTAHGGAIPTTVRHVAVGCAMFVLAGGIAAAAIAGARAGAVSPGSFRYTEFWLAPARSESGVGTLGIRNAEGVAATYEIDLLEGDKLVGRWPPMRLAPDDTFTTTVALARAAPRQRMEARLFRDGDRDRIYRRVWLASPVAAAPAVRK
jgi:hypothetical protein